MNRISDIDHTTNSTQSDKSGFEAEYPVVRKLDPIIASQRYNYGHLAVQIWTPSGTKSDT